MTTTVTSSTHLTVLSLKSYHTCLFLPTITDVWRLYTDASTRGIGSSLCIFRDGEWMPVSFYSCQLIPRERNYPIMELEVLASVEHFRFYLSDARSQFSLTILHFC